MILSQILPAYKDLSNYIFKEYYKNIRPGPGLVSLLNLKGDQLYEACLEYYSGSKIDPEELHQFGYDSLNKSQARFKELAVQLGYVKDSATFLESINAITSNQSLYFQTEKEIINAYQKSNEEIKGWIEFMLRNQN